MDRRAFFLALSLACGGPDSGPMSEATTGAEVPERQAPELAELIDWAGAERTREQALVRTGELAAELAEAGEGRREAIAAAMGRALLSVEGTAGIDNRLRVTLVRALGASGAAAARAPLTTLARRRRNDQPFALNRLALQALAADADEGSLPVLIEGLFLFGANPAMRMNDVAVSGLARLGEAAVPPLLRVLAGEHPRARALASSYVDALQGQAPGGTGPSVEQVMASEALFGLGIVGHRSALEPLLATSRSSDPPLRVGAIMALVSLRPSLEDAAPVREALGAVLDAVNDPMLQLRLLAAAQRLGDPELAPLLLRVAMDDARPVELRVQAAESWARVTATDDRAAFRRLRRDPAIGEAVEPLSVLLEEAERCADLECWVAAFREHAASPVDAEGARKAATRIGQLGRGDARAISALVAELGHRDLQIRLAALRALDWIAIRGSRAAVQRIEELLVSEEGRAIGQRFALEAIPIRARLIAR